jgi:hypothetical protein
MVTEFIPFAQMSRREQREHLEKVHGLELEPIDSPARLHTADHRMHDGTHIIPVPHAHTKVARRTKR